MNAIARPLTSTDDLRNSTRRIEILLALAAIEAQSLARQFPHSDIERQAEGLIGGLGDVHDDWIEHGLQDCIEQREENEDPPALIAVRTRQDVQRVILGAMGLT
jgi:hypothetical protein